MLCIFMLNQFNFKPVDGSIGMMKYFEVIATHLSIMIRQDYLIQQSRAISLSFSFPAILFKALIFKMLFKVAAEYLLPAIFKPVPSKVRSSRKARQAGMYKLQLGFTPFFI